MFTGIISQTARIKAIQKFSNHSLITVKINHDEEPLVLGESVSINGVCLTVLRFSNENNPVFEMGLETLERTNLRELATSSVVNVERSLKLNGRLDGHFVTGHIDDIGKITNIKKIDDNYEFEIKYPKSIDGFLVSKGAICIDGISLTVNNPINSCFRVYIISHTYKNTILQFKKHGDFVNLETDILAKYIQKCDGRIESSNVSKKLNESFLREAGF